MSDSEHQLRGRPINERARVERRQQILAGARACIVEAGFHAASMSDIAARAGVSTANIYQYFANKDALIVALIQAGIEADIALIRRVSQTGMRPDALRKTLSPFFLTEIGHTAAVLNCEFASEAARNPLVARMLSDNEAAAFIGISDAIRAGQISGQVPPSVDPDLAAQQFAFIFDGLAGQLVRPGADGAALLERLVLHIIKLLHIPHP